MGLQKAGGEGRRKKGVEGVSGGEGRRGLGVKRDDRARMPEA